MPGDSAWTVESVSGTSDVRYTAKSNDRSGSVVVEVYRRQGTAWFAASLETCS